MIDLNNINFSYTVNQTLFEKLCLTAKSGHIYGLLGRNGAGKTSLLRILAGLIFPHEGDCTIMGMTPKDRRPDFLAQVYFMPEELQDLSLTINQYLTTYTPFYPYFSLKQFHQYLHAFTVNPKKNIHKLSYGQKKKFYIAFGLAANTRLFMLDEPTNGLDIPSKDIFRQILKDNMNPERLIIISTHQVYDIESLIDTVILLNQGDVICNIDLKTITKNLCFTQESQSPPPESCLYVEPNANGFAVVRQQSNAANSINLELFFKAMLANTKDMQRCIAEQDLC